MKLTLSGLASVSAALACAGCAGITQSNPEIRGRLLDASSKKPIVGAEVQINFLGTNRPNTKVLTNSGGAFRIPARYNFHIAYLQGPCTRLYLPMADDYWDNFAVAHPDYQSEEFLASRFSTAKTPGDEEPKSIVIRDLFLKPK